MATPGASPVQKRYTAGNCTLDVALQLSALSQWYPQPIVQDLRFKLWMQPVEQVQGVATLPRLIAEGDRATLQEISHYLSQKVQSSLTIAQINRNSSPALDPPPTLQLTKPLSYLQLCDLTTVIHQCEQAGRMLPVSLGNNVSSRSISYQSSSQSKGNVIPFATVRRRPNYGLAQQQRRYSQ